MSKVEISLGSERDADGNMLVKIGDENFGTLEGLKQLVDVTFEEEVLRKLKAAGVRFSMTDGMPMIHVPQAAARLVKLEGCAQSGVRPYDLRDDPNFAQVVADAVKSCQRRRLF